MIKIAPSILSADFSCLAKEIKSVEKAGADYIHLDIMDGYFVPNLTFGPLVIQSIRKFTELPFDAHLMVEKPLHLIDKCVDAGVDQITVHLEAQQRVSDLISRIKMFHKKVGISIKPHTKVSDLIPYLPEIDWVLLMSVEPGEGGQKFMSHTLEKIVALKDLIGRKHIKIAVDGGINKETARACELAGADVLVSGSVIFKSSNYAKTIRELKGIK